MRKLALLAALPLLAACDPSRPKLEAALAQATQISAEKDSLLRDVMATSQFIAEVNAEVAKVRAANASSPTMATANEMNGALSPSEQRTRLFGKIKEITTRLNDVESRLAASRRRVADLAGKNTDMTKQIAAFDSTIASFKQVIESQKTELTTLQSQVASLSTENTQLKADNAQLVSETTSLTGERDALTTEQNTVYYIVGTKAELLERHIIEQTGGVLGIGKAMVPARELNPADFWRVDRTKDAEIPLPKAGATYRIITRQDVQALETPADAKGRISGSLKIRSPETFWRATKYLIVVEM